MEETNHYTTLPEEGCDAELPEVSESVMTDSQTSSNAAALLGDSTPPGRATMAEARPHLRFVDDKEATLAGYHNWADVKLALPESPFRLHAHLRTSRPPRQSEDLKTAGGGLKDRCQHAELHLRNPMGDAGHALPFRDDARTEPHDGRRLRQTGS